MAPITPASDETNHQTLLDQLDLFAHPRPFRNPAWKPPMRRNKNVKQIISEASRREASMIGTQNNSGSSTPLVIHSGSATAGAQTPASGTGGSTANAGSIAQAAQRLDRLVLERNQQASASTLGVPAPAGVGFGGPPAVTYTNIEGAPSLHPSSQRHYCDITGLPAPYTDPKTRLRYHDKEVFGLIRTMAQATTEAYLAARGAHTVLK